MMSEQDIRQWLKESKERLNEAQEDDVYQELELEIEILEAILEKWVIIIYAKPVKNYVRGIEENMVGIALIVIPWGN